MTDILQAIRNRVLISDGAWGTLLQKKGLKPGECPEGWNITHREKVLEIAVSYFEAGSDMIETNSFGGNKYKLEKYGLSDRVGELNQAAAAISRQAAGNGRWVLGSVGPTGKLLIMDEVTREELYQTFAEQAKALEEGGADAIIVETMTDLEEAVIAVRASAENTLIPVFCTMTFDKLITNDYRTMMGISPAEMIHPLIEAGASVIGANCGNGIADMIPIVKGIREAHLAIPIIVHANAGMPVLRDGETVFPETPSEMAARLQSLINAGANVIGGCCGTTPQHISMLRQTLQEL
jgi:5-methyltetrahydrofolate--homocysteine methyltransferase